VECDALLLDEEARTDTYPYIEINDEQAQIGHEATVSKIGDEQLFYLMSRGLSEDAAATMVVAASSSRSPRSSPWSTPWS
jgi:Fe-S cluster assembly protein SufB